MKDITQPMHPRWSDTHASLFRPAAAYEPPRWGTRAQCNTRSSCRRRAGRPRARRRSRLARHCLHADREDRRLDRAAEDGPRRRAHHGVLPALGHRRLGRRLALPARLSAGQHLCHRPQRLRARPRALSRPRPSAAARKARRSASAAAGHVRSDPARFARFARSHAALPHASWSRSRKTPIGVTRRGRECRDRRARDDLGALPRRHRRRRAARCARRSASP